TASPPAAPAHISRPSNTHIIAGSSPDLLLAFFCPTSTAHRGAIVPRSCSERENPGTATVKPRSCHGQFPIKGRRKGEVAWVLMHFIVPYSHPNDTECNITFFLFFSFLFSQII